MPFTNEKLIEVGQKVANQLFSHENHISIGEKQYSIKYTRKNNLKHVKIDDYVFMEQNPNKDSKWATLSKKGHEIIWIFENWDYIGRIMDGEVSIF